MTSSLIIVGGGGHAREIMWLAANATEPFRVLGYLDDVEPEAAADGDAPYLGPVEHCADHARAQFVVAIGAPRLRQSVVARMRALSALRFARLIHRDTTLSGSVDIGEGSQICAGVRITTDVVIGSHAIVNQNCTIAHDCRLGDFVTLAPLVALSGAAQLEDGVEVGTGAAVRQGAVLGRGSMAGMGATIVADVPAQQLVVGNPARLLRTLEAFPSD